MCERSRRRARDKRDFTVPSDTPSASAIAAMLIPRPYAIVSSPRSSGRAACNASRSAAEDTVSFLGSAPAVSAGSSEIVRPPPRRRSRRARRTRSATRRATIRIAHAPNARGSSSPPIPRAMDNHASCVASSAQPAPRPPKPSQSRRACAARTGCQSSASVPYASRSPACDRSTSSSVSGKSRSITPQRSAAGQRGFPVYRDFLHPIAKCANRRRTSPLK